MELQNNSNCVNDCDEEMLTRLNRVNELKQIPQYEQKSDGWLKQRMECISATGIATAIDEDPYKYPIELLFDKCGRGEPFVDNPNVHHGKKYEPLGTMYFSFRNNVKVGEYGLIKHDEYTFIGASPDGICEIDSYDGSSKSRLVGKLLEIKFPKIRKIQTTGDLNGDICPHYYWTQVQTQILVTGAPSCFFLQIESFEYQSWSDFVEDTHDTHLGISKKTGLEKGCMIQLFSKSMIGKPFTDCLYNAKYIYPPRLHMSPSETKDWIAETVMSFHSNELAKDYYIERVLYWRFNKAACHSIDADSEWIESKIPLIKQFWRYILFYRKNQSKLDDLVKYVETTGKSKSKAIFEYIHNDYKTAHPGSLTQPLFQEENEWRKKYNEKKKSYRK